MNQTKRVEQPIRMTLSTLTSLATPTHSEFQCVGVAKEVRIERVILTTGFDNILTLVLAEFQTELLFLRLNCYINYHTV